MAADGRYAATIGFFDGVHRGHRFLISHLKEVAEQRGLQSMVITFERHPRQVVNADWQPQLLTSLAERTRLLAKTGIDMLVVLRFDAAMAQLSAQQFMQLLHDDLQVATLLTGYDNRFGHDRTETFSDYERYGRQMGIEVLAGTPCDVAQKPVSSSRIRRLIGEGDMLQAADCLGRCYTVSGRVVHGEQIGRTLGFPTANLQIDDPCRLIPAPGVYAVGISIGAEDRQTVTEQQSVIGQRSVTEQQSFGGMMNIGTRPTFDGHRTTLEVNIFDFNADIYDRRLTVSFLERLRSEQHFSSPEALTEQMRRDAERARILTKQFLSKI
ncbi:MAG: bifunctional riboflavin kinase/FAD synthetase [Prevotella sp.]|nr:bifunctional riboflavin kinase/FAD synthetase [Prevotella sp.]